MDSLQSNIMTLKQGGTISGIHLGPLPSNFLNLWKIIDEDWNVYQNFCYRQNIKKTELRRESSHARTVTIAEKNN